VPTQDRSRVAGRLWPLLRPLIRGLEWVVWGGSRRGRLLDSLFVGYHRSLYRREWMLMRPGDQPHFFDHRLGAALLATGNGTPYGWSRGFYALEVLRPTDRVLDIGSGDGFFDARFFSERCQSIDAIDIEESAITHARRHNPAGNVTYMRLDAVNDAFPNPPYDVVIWDGAIGHFAPNETEHMLLKIRDSLTEDGIFVGSESLGAEGHDHLQFFNSPDDLRSLLGNHFPYIDLRRMRYSSGSGVRDEAYWRCSLRPGRLEEVAWHRNQ
jgi:SAM-dependent methyltransferase